MLAGEEKELEGCEEGLGEETEEDSATAAEESEMAAEPEIGVEVDGDDWDSKRV